MLLAEVFTWLGLAVGYFTPYPVGFYITSFAFGAYALVRSGEYRVGRRGRRRSSAARRAEGGAA